MRMDPHRPQVTVLTAGGAGVTSKPRNPPAAIPDATSSSITKANHDSRIVADQREAQNVSQPTVMNPSLEYETEEEHAATQQPDGTLPTATLVNDNSLLPHTGDRPHHNSLHESQPPPHGDDPLATKPVEILSSTSPSSAKTHELVWLLVCFLGIMASFVCYGLLLEWATSGDNELHELSFLFVTSALYTLTAAAGRYVRDETPTTIPPARFAILGLTSMGSTFFSVRSLRYVRGESSVECCSFILWYETLIVSNLPS